MSTNRAVCEQRYRNVKPTKRVFWATKEAQAQSKAQKMEFPEPDELAKRAQAVVDTDPRLTFWIASPCLLQRIGQRTGFDLLGNKKQNRE